MRSNKGFTLIELIVVIVVLGILAVTAAPKFIGVQDEAQAAVAEGISGAIQSASNMAHGKALVNNVSGTVGTPAALTVSGVGDIDMVFGYPASTDGIADIIEAPSGWTAAENATTFTLTKGSCVITYTQATSATAGPSVAAAGDDCS